VEEATLVMLVLIGRDIPVGNPLPGFEALLLLTQLTAGLLSADEVVSTVDPGFSFPTNKNINILKNQLR
jgi:hypothetical protein